MAIVIEAYRPEHEAAVQEFNRRLQQSSGNPDLVFSSSAIPRWLPPGNNNSVWNEFFVAVEGSSVRGAYALKQEIFFIRGKDPQRVACYHHPLSEGIINRSYASVGVLLARDALARQPFLYALGMGGSERPLAKMLKLLGFSLVPIPFYFRVVRPTKFLLQMLALREKPWRRLGMNVAAATGTGWLAIRLAQATSSLRGRAGDFASEEIAESSDWASDDWADELWHRAQGSVSMAAVRDAATLRLLYLNSLTTVKRLRVTRNGVPVGWAITGIRRKDSKFGNMRVGSIVDCWASREDCEAVIQAATQALETENVDLIVSNQGHQMWGRAFECSGFFKGPSTFVFAASKALTELLQPLEQNRPLFHITRADGDGLPANY